MEFGEPSTILVDLEGFRKLSIGLDWMRWFQVVARQKKSSTRIGEWKRRLSLAKWKPWSVRKRRVWVGITMGTMDTGESLHADEMQRHSSRWCALGTKIFRLDSTEGTLPDALNLENREISSKRSYFFFLLFLPPLSLLSPSLILYAFYAPRVNLEYRLIIEFTSELFLMDFIVGRKTFEIWLKSSVDYILIFSTSLPEMRFDRAKKDVYADLWFVRDFI